MDGTPTFYNLTVDDEGRLVPAPWSAPLAPLPENVTTTWTAPVEDAPTTPEENDADEG